MKKKNPEAVEIADSFREEFAQTEIVHDNEIIKVTTSIGVSGYGPGVEAFGDVLRLADEALYQAKARGRNCVSVKKLELR